jgi:hypothetical protein
MALANTYRVRIELPTGGRMTVIKQAYDPDRAKQLAERDNLSDLPAGSRILGATKQRP